MKIGRYIFIIAALSCTSVAVGQDSLQVRRLGQCILTPHLAAAVIIRDTLAFTPFYGFNIFNIANPRAPVQCGYLQTFSLVYSMGYRHHIAYLGTSSNALYVVDVTNPSDPILLNTFYGAWSGGPQVYMTMYRDFVFIACVGSGLRILNVSNPTEPVEVGSYDVANNCLGVAVREGYAYVAYGNGGLRIVDVSDPASPTEVGVCGLPDHAIRVAVGGNYAYVADYYGGLRVIDVSNPHEPTEVGSCPTQGAAIDVTVQGDYVYLLDWDNGLRICDISSPQSPVEVGYYKGPAFQGIAVQGCLALASMSDYVGVYDVSYFSPCTLPSAVHDLTIRPISFPQIMRLRWTPVLDTNGLPTVIDRYEIYRATNEELGDWQYLGTPAPPFSSVFIDSSGIGQRGYYQVRAVAE